MAGKDQSALDLFNSFNELDPPRVLEFENSLTFLAYMLMDHFDCEIESEICLIDPITLSQYKQPCRALECKHIEPFEYEVYVHFNKSKLPFEYCCPICKTQSNPSKVYIDALFLCFVKLYPNEETMIISKRGLFQPRRAKEQQIIIDVESVDSADEVNNENDDPMKEQPITFLYKETKSFLRKQLSVTTEELCSVTTEDIEFILNHSSPTSFREIVGCTPTMINAIIKERPYVSHTMTGLRHALRAAVERIGDKISKTILNHFSDELRRKFSALRDEIEQYSGFWNLQALTPNCTTTQLQLNQTATKNGAIDIVDLCYSTEESDVDEHISSPPKMSKEPRKDVQQPKPTTSKSTEIEKTTTVNNSTKKVKKRPLEKTVDVLEAARKKGSPNTPKKPRTPRTTSMEREMRLMQIVAEEVSKSTPKTIVSKDTNSKSKRPNKTNFAPPQTPSVEPSPLLSSVPSYLEDLISSVDQSTLNNKIQIPAVCSLQNAVKPTPPTLIPPPPTLLVPPSNEPLRPPVGYHTHFFRSVPPPTIDVPSHTSEVTCSPTVSQCTENQNKEVSTSIQASPLRVGLARPVFRTQQERPANELEKNRERDFTAVGSSFQKPDGIQNQGYGDNLEKAQEYNSQRTSKYANNRSRDHQFNQQQNNKDFHWTNDYHDGSKSYASFSRSREQNTYNDQKNSKSQDNRKPNGFSTNDRTLGNNRLEQHGNFSRAVHPGGRIAGNENNGFRSYKQGKYPTGGSDRNEDHRRSKGKNSKNRRNRSASLDSTISKDSSQSSRKNQDERRNGRGNQQHIQPKAVFPHKFKPPQAERNKSNPVQQNSSPLKGPHSPISPRGMIRSTEKVGKHIHYDATGSQLISMSNSCHISNGGCSSSVEGFSSNSNSNVRNELVDIAATTVASVNTTKLNNKGLDATAESVVMNGVDSSSKGVKFKPSMSKVKNKVLEKSTSSEPANIVSPVPAHRMSAAYSGGGRKDSGGRRSKTAPSGQGDVNSFSQFMVDHFIAE